MTPLSRITHLFFAAALSCAVMAIFLIKQYKLGLPLNFAGSMTLAVITGVVIPVAASVLYTILRRGHPGRLLTFELTCLLIALVLAAITF
jgi:hypothetical protein